jgi:hypothetical protein
MLSGRMSNMMSRLAKTRLQDSQYLCISRMNEISEDQQFSREVQCSAKDKKISTQKGILLVDLQRRINA